MGDLKLRPNRALKYFLKNQRCSEEIKSGHLLFRWVKKNERLLTNPKVIFNEVLFANTSHICVDLSSKFRVSTDFEVIRDHLHRVSRLSIP